MEYLKLNNRDYKLSEVLSLELAKNQFSECEFQTLSIIQDWFSDKEKFQFQTSGSTGEPKKIVFTRAQIKASASRTINTFQLRPGQTMLCCLNTSFVAGFMMLIRAFEGNLKLIISEPSLNPLKNFEKKAIDFVAMTPIQVQTTLEQNPEKFRMVKKLLIGGANIHLDLEKKLRMIDSEVFHSYAMTETLTHVAIRNVSKVEHCYQAMEGITFEVNDHGWLNISDQKLGINNLQTNDIVELDDGRSFKWIGRSDNIINSGGIKINLDNLEVNIERILLNNGMKPSICLLSKPDAKLSNKIVLLVQKQDSILGESELIQLFKNELPKYHDPKQVMVVPEIYFTKTGKVDRLKNADRYL